MDQDIPFERIGGYRILRRLATGGTSDVLLARAEGPHGFERTVVLKLLLQQFRRDAPMEKMFAREAAAYSRLSHPAIVKLYDFFSAEGQLVMVLEYIEGLPLNRFRAMLRKNGEHLDDRASIFIASRVFAALAAAHGARDPESGEFAPVIHRDVNPSNILIPWDGHVKLADFGIAKVAGVSSDTQSGFIKGTYGYMAPEQVRGEPITVRTDMYAGALLLWELLARRKAIQRGALPELEVLRAMAEPSLPSLDMLRPDLPQRLRDAVARGLETSPDARSVTAEEMLIVLRESVTSNEGRNVLAEALARARTEIEGARSVPPPPVTEAGSGTPSSDRIALRSASGVKVAPHSTGARTPSEVAMDAGARTALGTGQVAAVTPIVTAEVTSVVAGARADLPAGSGAGAPPPSTRAVPPRVAAPPPGSRQMATSMGLGVMREAVGGNLGGTYRSVGSAGRAVAEDRTKPGRMGKTMVGGVAAPPLPPPPPPPAPPPLPPTGPATIRDGDSLPGTDSLPPVLGGLEGGGGAARAAQATIDDDAAAAPATERGTGLAVGTNGPAHAGDPASPPATLSMAAPERLAGAISDSLGSLLNAPNALLAPPPYEAPAPPPLPPPPGPPAPPPAMFDLLEGSLPPPAPLPIRTPASPPPPPPPQLYAPPPAPPSAVSGPASPLATTSPLLGNGKNGAHSVGRVGPIGTPDPAMLRPIVPMAPMRALPLTPSTVPPPASAKGGAYVVIAGVALVLAVAVVGGVLLILRGPAGAAADKGRHRVASTSVAAGGATTGSATAAGSPTTIPSATAEPTTMTRTGTPSPPASAVASASAAPVSPVAVPAPPPAPAPAIPTVVAAAAPSAPSSAEGDIVTPAQAGGHRVFVDGRYAGDSPGPVRVHCGSHSVKIGSSGVAHIVDVPCGGQVSVSQR